MEIEKPDAESKEAVIEQIKKLAEVYTPEWKMDPMNPDAGTALALLFADMFSGTLQRYDRIPQKLCRDFFEQMELTVRPASLAEGYVTFSLSSREFGGAKVEKGTVVLATGSETCPETFYETMEELWVTPAEITQLILIDGQQDYIEKKEWRTPFEPFTPDGENQQKHMLYLCQNEVLSVTGQAEIRLKLEAEEIGWLLNLQEVSIAYSTEDGFLEFAGRNMEQGYLVLRKSAFQKNPAAMEICGRSGYWIRLCYKEAWKREPLMVKDIRLAAQKEGMEPDCIRNGFGEQQNTYLQPFGECPALFNECCIASKEALGKAGAKIRVSFHLSYEKIPLDNSVPVDRNWKFLMRRSDFKPDPEYDITIEQVIWEYYNGSGWSRLPLKTDRQHMFNGKNGRMGAMMELEFLCPMDVALLKWQCAPTRYIRVRVLRMNNLYRLKGFYITPVIRDIRFHYRYTGEGRHPDFAAVFNRMEETVFPVKALEHGQVSWKVFYGFEDRARSLYLGFSHPFSGGPVRLLCTLEDSAEVNKRNLLFEYYGKKGFLPLPILDETSGLQKSGCLTFPEKEDFTQLSICGETAYWVRITDQAEVYQGQKTVRDELKITGLFLNTVKIRAAESLHSSGAKGNRHVGEVNRLGSALGFVNRVTNYIPVCGAYDQETVSEAMQRGRRALCHWNRAVTAGDYEALAYEASRCVQKVKCCPGRNLRGEHEPGRITLVVLQKEFEHGGMYFHKIRDEIMGYLSKRMEGNLAALGRVSITEPYFLEMDCYVKITVAEHGCIVEVKNKVEKALCKFIHPVTGNYHGKGWEIGTYPDELQLINALKDLQEIQFVRELRTKLAPCTRQEGADLTRGHDRISYAVALSGKHIIEVDTE